MSEAEPQTEPRPGDIWRASIWPSSGPAWADYELVERRGDTWYGHLVGGSYHGQRLDEAPPDELRDISLGKVDQAYDHWERQQPGDDEVPI